MITVADAWVAKKPPVFAAPRQSGQSGQSGQQGGHVNKLNQIGFELGSGEGDRYRTENQNVDADVNADVNALSDVVRDAVEQGATQALAAQSKLINDTRETRDTRERDTKRDVGLWIAMGIAAIVLLATFVGVFASAVCTLNSIRQQGEWMQTAVFSLQQQLLFQQQQMHAQQLQSNQNVLTLALALSALRSPIPATSS